MGLFDLFFGGDPTKDWPPGDGSLPAVDLSRGTFGTLRFGDDLDAARVFGRPDQCRRRSKTEHTLVYAGRGFELVFQRDGLCFVTFFIGPSQDDEDYEGLVHCQPRLANGLQLSHQTTRADILQHFGEPEYEEPEQGETILSYDTAEPAMDFYVDGDERLVKWMVYVGD